MKALKAIGAKTVKVLYVDFPSEAAAIAYGIADNKSSEWAQWDDALLDSFMQMEEVALDLKRIGMKNVKKVVEEQFIVGKFAVEVECADEAQQQEVFEKLSQEGYSCRILTL